MAFYNSTNHMSSVSHLDSDLLRMSNYGFFEKLLSHFKWIEVTGVGCQILNTSRLIISYFFIRWDWKVFLQESLYNIARAFHHVGLVTLAAFYYEKVIAICEKDYPIPKLPNENPDSIETHKPGYCDLRREAAYNLHLIYKKSGALDLARQVLRDYCTLWVYMYLVSHNGLMYKKFRNVCYAI